MTTCPRSRCSPAEAHAGMHCRPLYLQGLTVICQKTLSLILSPPRPTTRFDGRIADSSEADEVGWVPVHRMRRAESITSGPVASPLVKNLKRIEKAWFPVS